MVEVAIWYYALLHVISLIGLFCILTVGMVLMFRERLK